MSFELSKEYSNLNSTTPEWLAIPRTCRCVKGVAVVETVLTTADETVTVSADGDTIGTFTITKPSTVGDTYEMVLGTTERTLDEDTPLKMVSTSASGAGKINCTFTLSEFLS